MNDDQRRFISPGRVVRLKLIGALLLILALTLSCKLIETPVDKAIDAVDRLSALLERNSDDWEAIADRVLDELPIEARSLIDHEVNNVIQRGIAASGVEFRCDVDFVRKRVRDDLYRLKAELLQRKGVHVQVPARTPAFCHTVPEVVEQDTSWLTFYGYDFDAAGVQVLLQNGASYRDVTGHLDHPTHYNLTLVIGGSTGVRLQADSTRFILRWNDQDQHSVGIRMPESAPPAVRFVQAAGTVNLYDHENIESDEFGSFEIDWTVPVDELLLPETGYANSWCTGDEVRGELMANVSLEPDGSMYISGDIRYFEGTSCNTSDIEGSFPFSYNLAPGKSGTLDHKLMDSDGYADFNVTFFNKTCRLEPRSKVLLVMGDDRVRRALERAVDWRTLIDRVYGEEGSYFSFVTIDAGCRQTDLAAVVYDPDGGRQLLAEAGYGGGSSLELVYWSQDNALKVMAYQLEVLLPQAGIPVRLSPHDSALMRDRLVVLAGGR